MRESLEINMAKVQKSLLINEDLVRLVESIQKKTGANFTRMITAAVLQYLFNDPDGPNQLWMEYAVALDNGELGVGDMPRERLNTVAAESLTGIDTKITPGHEVEEIPDEFDQLLKRWRIMQERNPDDGVQGIIDHWNRAK